MTTTLRPSGPEQRTDGGGRARAYDVCVNGRPVGTVRLAAEERHGLRAGRIVRLAVDDADRGRGRATVAALAAEEVLRDWGCTGIDAAVPADAPGALRLAAALGYTERNRYLVKEVSGAPELPAGSALRPMTAPDFAVWREEDLARLTEVLTEGGVPRDRAAAEADRGQRALLPDGPATDGMSLSVLTHRGVDVGILWLRLDGAPLPAAEVWVYAVAVHEEHRGHGHGRTLMRAAERACAAAGSRVLGLNVQTANTPARRLYETLGYRTVERHFWKPLL